MDLSQHALQSLHSLPCSGAGHVRLLPGDATVDVHGQNLTGPWSIMCDDILIIKFGGTLSGSTCFRNCASRVGIQCCVELVRLHTSNIFSRCLRLCISPESCHLKYFSPWMSTVMASTQRGSSSAASLLVNACCTLVNR